jgi:hypothetical protein
MLPGQTGFPAGGSDIFHTQTFPGDAGQRQARSQYLPSPLARAAIDEYRFHIIPRRLEIGPALASL